VDRELLKDFLREMYPNPERKGCPEEDALKALAEDHIAPNDAVLLHVGSCSECYSEYLHYRQDFEEAKEQQRPRQATVIEFPDRTKPNRSSKDV
jgi:hypothetical protein